MRVLPTIRRLVVKVGSAVIAPAGQLEQQMVNRFSDELVPLIRRGLGVTIVSSGAVASGFRSLGLAAPPDSIAQKQAAAAIGQPRLMEAWSRAFAHHGLAVAQVLYTADDLADRRRFLNARRTLDELLDLRVTPIVNENDTISFDEIKLGDNDRLSALTVDLVRADLLLILSTAQGLYEDGDPKRIIATVRDTAAAEKNVRAEKSATGVGGMATKLTAAGMAAQWGVPTIVAGGTVERVIERVLAGELLGTLFEPAPSKQPSRKRWLAVSARAKGTIQVDDGAAGAILKKGASLLPRGVTAVNGKFERGAVVDIADQQGTAFARGLANFSNEEIMAIKGARTAEIETLLGYFYAPEVVHRNDLTLL